MINMFEYNSILLEALKSNPIEQPPVGYSPKAWADKYDIEHNFIKLPNTLLDRSALNEICANQNSLFAYICIMAWGLQGSGPGASKNVIEAWKNRSLIKEKIDALKKGELNRIEAYDLFCGSNKVPGLGPAYFTKLLCFFSPKKDMYIMDQWTTKAILLLTNKNIIKHSKTGPTQANDGHNYELFCRFIDDLTSIIQAQNGQEVEQRLFSNGALHGNSRGVFRQFIFDKWKNKPKFNRYNHNFVLEILNHTN